MENPKQTIHGSAVEGQAPSSAPYDIRSFLRDCYATLYGLLLLCKWIAITAIIIAIGIGMDIFDAGYKLFSYGAAGAILAKLFH